MNQLSAEDAIFLSMETPNSHSHIGGLTFLDPGEAVDFGYERFEKFLCERIRLAPRFGWKLQEVALGLDRPYWVEDEHYDPRRHLRRIGVPSPGGLRELTELASWLFSQPLERGRPLWEIWYIEGLENGRIALLMKAHHCLMDGASGASLGEILCDLEPDPGTPLAAIDAGALEPAPEVPTAAGMTWRALNNWLRTPGELTSFAGAVLRQGVHLARTFGDPEAPPLPYDVPSTSFNADPGPRRGFACTTLPLADVRRVRKHFDVTVNDVLLALTGSGLRQYLLERDELPEKSLVALCPVSRRKQGDTAMNNQVTNMAVSWATNREDAVERLLAVSRNAKASKSLLTEGDANVLDAFAALPPGLANLLIRNSSASTTPLPGNAVVSNVRGTPIPLYVAGARVDAMYPLSILSVGQGLNITVVSYMGKVDIGFTVDPDLVPDPWALADAVRGGLRELLTAVEADLARERSAA